MMYISAIISVLFGVISSYVYWIGIGLGTRMVALPHFGVNSMVYFGIMIFYDEVRKVYVREGMKKGRGMKSGWMARNTYY